MHRMTTHTLRIGSVAIAAWAAACPASVRAVELVPFLEAVSELRSEESPESAVERVAFESRSMQFPEDAVSPGGTVVSERVIEDRVIASPMPVPGAPGSRNAASRNVEEPTIAAEEEDRILDSVPPVDAPEIMGGEILIEEPAVEEMPVLASSGKWFTSGFWYGSGESLWFDRSRNKRVTVGVDTLDTRFQFTTLAQPFDVSPGARGTLGRSLGRDYLGRDRFIEFTYYGGFQWSGVDAWNSLTASPTLISPLGINVPGFNLANTYATSLDSNFNSIELNFRLRRRLGRDQMVMSPNGGWSRHAERGYLPGLILGLRLANVDEDFWFRSRRDNVAPEVFSGNYDITTQNWLLGMNIGGELVSQNEFYFWGLRGRAAPALTFASTQQSVVGINTTNIPANPVVPSPVIRSDENTQTSPGFIGDLTLFAGWNVTPNFALKVGYDFLWVAGIATATRQFNLDDVREDPMDAGGQIFYNGVSFGFEGSW